MSICRWEKTILIIPLLFAALKVQSPSAIAIEVDSLLNSLTTSALENRFTRSWLFAQNTPSCPQLNSDYRGVYQFETQSFYISICQRDNNYFYHRQSKLDSQETLLLPAQIVFGGDVYQAIDGRTIYFVGMDDNGYYSSVMHNNSEIVFEPELKSSATTVAGTETDSASTNSLNIGKSNASDNLPVDVETNDNNSLNSPSATLTSKADLEPQVCTQDSNNLDPNFDGWQEFIGKSSETVGEYATNKGHYFSYDEESPKQALIETKEGLVVNLDIADVSQTVRRVCVNPIVSSDTQF